MSEMKFTLEGSFSVRSGLLSSWSWPLVLKDLEEGVEQNVPNYWMMGSWVGNEQEG